ncbi:hypothetical protein M0805_007237 [Coniferiporia weirii]|nr:hypothetical protein M0805_007237 [Coniferiporia weirii]
MSGINLNLNTLTENTSRLSARISESIIEHTRDLAITRSPGASYFDAPEEKVRNVRKQLDANSDRDKLDALKTLIALISKGRNVSEFFPSVVKNVASPNLEIRKLVYIYLLRYAEAEPDLALLSINTFQRDLTDANPLIRAMALRVLSGINVPMVGNIVVLAVKKCAADPSPYVRKAAALATIKCYNMDSAHLPSLIPILSMLLKDKSPLSIGAVTVAFQAICPTRLDLLHTHYRRLCRMLLDADSWGQVSVLELLARYARSMLPNPVVFDASGDEVEGSEGKTKEKVDPDLQLLLNNAEPLLMSRNPAVVMAVARVFFYLAPPSQLVKVVSPLLRLLPTSKEVERVVLAYLVVITREAPQLFVPYYTRFLIRTTDIREVKRDKLRILLRLLSSENYQVLLSEFVVYAEDPDAQIVSEAIQAIGHCARSIPDSVTQCLSALMEFIKQGSEPAISSAILVLKALVQTRLNSQTPASASPAHSPLAIIADLAGRIDEIKHPSARACVIWLVGQYAAPVMDERGNSDSGDGVLPGVAWWAPDVLRKVAKTFPSEAPIVKLQLLTMAAKLQVLSSTYHHTLALLTRYVFSLARYDANYDVRDRARMLNALLAGVAPHLQSMNGSDDRHADGDFGDEGEVFDQGGVVLRREQVKLVLFEGKLGVQEKEPFPDNSDILGSLELITEKPMGLGTNPRLPDWPEEGTDASLRDAEEEYPSVPITAPGSRGLSGMAGSTSGFGSSQLSSNVATPVVLTPTGVSPSAPGTPSGKGPWIDLDKFYEDAGDSEEEEGEEGEEEEDEDEDEEGEEGEDTDTESEEVVEEHKGGSEEKNDSKAEIRPEPHNANAQATVSHDEDEDTDESEDTYE